jgi:transketolase
MHGPLAFYGHTGTRTGRRAVLQNSSETSGSNVSLASRAWAIRRYALRMAEVQGQGYVGQALGVADVLATSYFHAMDHRSDDPEWDGRDRFYLSIGHYAIAHYAALIEAGILPEDEIETYGMDDSRMPMSGMAAYTPGMEITGGSLGHGLGIAVGAALGLKRKASSSFVYNMLSDGELGEGSTWEAVMSAVQWKLDNLIAIVDFNNQQADGPTLDALATPEEAPKWTAFGWYAQEVDGNDLSALVQAFDNARNHPEPRPRVIICHTKMCKGIPFLEERESTHFIRVEPDEWAKAIAVLDEDKPL